MVLKWCMDSQMHFRQIMILPTNRQHSPSQPCSVPSQSQLLTIDTDMSKLSPASTSCRISFKALYFPLRFSAHYQSRRLFLQSNLLTFTPRSVRHQNTQTHTHTHAHHLPSPIDFHTFLTLPNFAQWLMKTLIESLNLRLTFLTSF
jgi:hypothetical protein